MEANKNEKTYLKMIIIGGILFAISIILFIVGGTIILLNTTDSTIKSLDSLDFSNFDVQKDFLAGAILCGIGWLTLLASFGLFGPGIPLFIVTIVRKKKRYLNLKNWGCKLHPFFIISLNKLALFVCFNI